MKTMLLRGNPTFVLHCFLPSAKTHDNCEPERGSATAATQCTVLKFCIRSSEQMQFSEQCFNIHSVHCD